ncbi:unnamed protein product, partial [Iphiclides podalirius]
MGRSASSCLRGHLVVLRRAGYWRLDGGPPRRQRLHACYCWLVFAITLFYLVQEFVYAYQERGDMVKLSRVMFLLLCHVTSIIKQLVFQVDADRIETMIKGLDEPCFKSDSSAAQWLLRSTAAHAARLRGGFAGCAVLTCALWAVFPAQAHARGLHVEFPLWTGLDTSHTFGFLSYLISKGSN